MYQFMSYLQKGQLKNASIYKTLIIIDKTFSLTLLYHDLTAMFFIMIMSKKLTILNHTRGTAIKVH